MFTQIPTKVIVHVSFGRYSQDLAYIFICINEVSRGVCQAESAKLWAGRFRDDLEERCDFGVFWSLLRCRAAQTCQMFRYGWRPSIIRSEVMPVLLRSGQSVSRERAVYGTNGMSIDGEPLPSIDGDARIWAEHIL
ncbi:hypothetical protein DY000_02052917 [Brassica cretica]|uniref:Uncharacterized protein n=1 Tax=Brassica cretica TaxID=69181 RepID=A0ABQ7AI68_BRACR|nr:hypothetical protein DY000_02052917 [Brassica cretica]